MTQKQTTLQLTFDGPSIKEGRILVNDLIDFISNFQIAVQKVVDVLSTGQSTRRGRPPRVLQELSALEITSFSPGSFAVDLDFRREEPRLPHFDLGEEAVDRLVAGLDTISTETSSLPDGFDQGVLMALRETGRILDRGIETVRIRSNGQSSRPLEATYSVPVREHILTHMRKLEQAWTVVEGRLLMADVREGTLRCRIHPSTGEPIVCAFNEDLLTLVIANLRGFVRAKGEANVDSFTNRISALTIRDIEPISEPVEREEPGLSQSGFWGTSNFSDLASEQGVYPIEDWDSLSQDWPNDEDVDAFLEVIMGSRQEPNG